MLETVVPSELPGFKCVLRSEKRKGPAGWCGTPTWLARRASEGSSSLARRANQQVPFFGQALTADRPQSVRRSFRGASPGTESRGFDFLAGHGRSVPFAAGLL